MKTRGGKVVQMTLIAATGGDNEVVLGRIPEGGRMRTHKFRTDEVCRLRVSAF